MLKGNNLERPKTMDDFATEKVDVVKNSLLGDYNKNGEYVIANELIDQLILLEKEKTSNFQNSIFCEATLDKFGKLQFELILKKNSKLGKAVGELYLLEDVEKINGYMVNTLRTPIVRYIEDLSDAFIAKTLAVFNIVDKKPDADDDGKELKIQDLDIDITLLENRKKFMKTVEKLTEKSFEKAYETYFNKRIALLKGQNSLYSKEVLAKFNEEYNKIEKYFLTTEKGGVKYKALNELLDNAMESISGIKPGYEADETSHKTQLNAFMSDFCKKIEDSKDKAFNYVKKDDELSSMVEMDENTKKITEEKPQETKVITPVDLSDTSIGTKPNLVNEFGVFKDLKDNDKDKEIIIAKENSPRTENGKVEQTPQETKVVNNTVSQKTQENQKVDASFEDLESVIGDISVLDISQGQSQKQSFNEVDDLLSDEDPKQIVDELNNDKGTELEM